MQRPGINLSFYTKPTNFSLEKETLYTSPCFLQGPFTFQWCVIFILKVSTVLTWRMKQKTVWDSGNLSMPRHWFVPVTDSDAVGWTGSLAWKGNMAPLTCRKIDTSYSLQNWRGWNRRHSSGGSSVRTSPMLRSTANPIIFHVSLFSITMCTASASHAHQICHKHYKREILYIRISQTNVYPHCKINVSLSKPWRYTGGLEV